MATDIYNPSPCVSLREASYVKPGYRSFEYANLEARAREVLAVLSSERSAARDVLLAVAGALRPTSGVLTVCGVELSRPVGSEGLRGRAKALLTGARRERMPQSAVGLGVVSGVAVPEAALTVEEVVSCELYGKHVPHGSLATKGGEPGGNASRTEEVLAYLGCFQLATRVYQRVGDLSALDRARLSAALAFACAPQVACVDLADPFCAGMSAEQAVQVVRELRTLAGAGDVAVLIAVSEPVAAVAADAAAALDVDAEEALAAVLAAQVTERVARSDVAATGPALRADPSSSDGAAASDTTDDEGADA